MLDPMIGIETGHTRILASFGAGELRLPKEEKMSVEDLLKGYTINNAIGIGKEAVIGSLEKGKFANLCILSDNLFEVADEEISSVKVEQSCSKGKLSSTDNERKMTRETK